MNAEEDDQTVVYHKSARQAQSLLSLRSKSIL